MKIANLIFLFMLILLHCKGQNLLQEGKMWSNTSIGTEGGSTYRSYFIKFMGDTTINGLAYKKILRSDDESHTKWTLNGCIREEPTTRKVFIFNEYSQKDMLLYDFSLNTGDGDSLVKVTNVINATFGTSKDIRKQIYFFDTSGNTRWIEGIGSTWGVLEGLNSFSTTGSYNNLVCYYENEQVVYHNPKFSTCFPQGFYNKTEVSFQKPPTVNITYEIDHVIFTFNEVNISNSFMQLFSLTGRKIIESQLNGMSKFHIPTSSLSPGIYIYRYINNGLTYSDKLVIK